MKRNMKQLFILAILGIMAGLGACKDDTPTPYAPEFEEVALPANDSITYITTMELKWTATDKNQDPLVYTVKVGSSAEALQVVASDVTESTYTLTDLAVGEYFWQIIADDANGGMIESPVWNFTIIEEPVAPAVAELTLSNMTVTSVTINSSVLNDGGDAVTERGIYWNTTGNAPDADDGTKVVVEGQVGDFTYAFENLEQVKYYVMAYATNDFGTTYSNPVAFVPQDMVLVEGGTFNMGKEQYPFTDQSPVHSVTISQNYLIGKYEVTHAQFINFLNSISCNTDGTFTDEEFGDVLYFKASDSDCAITHNGAFVFTPTKYAKTDDTPAIYVTWYGANAYAKWTGGYLPTEAQWEFAARGGNQSQNYNFSGSNDLNAVSWNNDNASEGYTQITQTVGTKAANELGIYDMTGNANEWCGSWYYTYEAGDVTDPNPETGDYKAYRGGSVRDYTSSDGVNFFVQKRFRKSLSYAYFHIGFRIAR